MYAGQQTKEQDACRVHIGAGGDDATQDLLGRSVLRRQRAAAGGGQFCVLVGFEQLRDAEIEKLDRAVICDKDVGRLQVTVHDEIRVCTGDGIEHIEHETHAIIGRDSPAVTVFVDTDAFHVLEHEIGLTDLADSGVEQARDVGMRELGEDVALAAESVFRTAADQCKIEQLDCHLPLESTIGPVCEPDLPHAATADESVEDVVAKHHAGERRRRRRGW